jgi:anion-transporting  ArsA/GET3 family ATPase
VLDLEFDSPLLFVTGKGGTGKTVVTAALAMHYGAQGKKVLLIDSENSGDLARVFEHESVGYQPVELTRNVFLTQTSTDDALTEYLRLYAKIPTWAKLTPLARLIDIVSNTAPGVREILITGKICFETKKILEGNSDFDMVIVDAPSSGHVISILDAPRALSEIVSRGMIQNQTEWMQDILHDENQTKVLVVTTSDDVVIAESRELISQIRSETQTHLGGVIVNKQIADLRAPLSAEESGGVMTRVRTYYGQVIQRMKNAIDSMDTPCVYSFPLLLGASTLRSLAKNSNAFDRIDR